jgi:hypothetical protein
MPDDLTLTPPTGKTKIVGYPPSVVVGEDDRWTLPPSDKIEKMSRKALRDRIRAIIEHAERGDAQNRRGGIELAIIRAQYLTQELARRSQNRQTWLIIIMTAVITVMTLIIMVVTIWPEWDQSPAHSLLTRASQVIDLWWQRGRSLARAIHPQP